MRSAWRNHLRWTGLVGLALALLLGPVRAQAGLPQLTEAFLNRLSDEARLQFERGYARLAEPPSDPTLAGQLGMIAQAHEQYQLAIDFYHLAEAGAPQAFEWPYYTGACWSRLGQVAAAIEAFERARALDSTYVPLQLHLADALFDANRWEDSRRLYEQVLATHPDIAPAHFGRGKALRELGRLDEAIVAFREACRLYPHYGGAHYALAQTYRLTGRLELAKTELEAYQSHRLHRPVVGDGLLNAIADLKSGSGKAQELLKAGIAAGERGDLETAVRRHQEAVQLDPDFLQAWVNLIILHGRRGDLEGARQAFSQAIAIEPDTADAYYNYGVALFAQAKYEEARQAFEQTLKIRPNYGSALNYLGQIAELHGDYAAADEWYRKALESEPGLRPARFNRARMLIAHRKNEEAIEELHRLLETPDDQAARYLFAIATAHFRAGRLAEGRDFAEQARAKAIEFGQTELQASIERELAKLQKP